jgi:hypothetical protein
MVPLEKDSCAGNSLRRDTVAFASVVFHVRGDTVTEVGLVVGDESSGPSVQITLRPR